MLSFFRNITKSRIGLIVVFLVLGIIALAFAAGDVTGMRSVTTGSGAVVARVGDRNITEKELKDRVQIAVDNLRRRGQTVTVEQFLAAGGLEQALDQLINSAAIEQFARDNGIMVGDRVIDGQIASNTAFQGPDGKFDQATYQALLARERIAEGDLRADLRSSTYIDWLIGPASNAQQAPTALAMPYAALVLEERKGALAFIPTAAMDPGAAPTDEQVSQYYEQHKAQYTIPERRVIRYAMVSPETLGDRTKPTEEEIAQAYRAAGNRFAATEKRSIDQVIVADQQAAQKLADAVKGGQSIDAAARAAGLEPSSFDETEKAEFAEQTSPAVADAAFGATQGSVVGPVQSPLGWHVLRVTSVEQVAAQSLAQAHDTLAKEVADKKLVEALVAVRDQISDSIADGGTFQEVLSDTKLQAQSTEPVLANGRNPDKPDAEPDAQIAPLVRAGFQMDVGGEPQIVAIDDTHFAVVTVGRVVPATPRPLKDIRDAVARDYRIDKGVAQAREVASQVVEAVAKGKSFEDALDATRKVYRYENIDVSRAELARAQQQIPPQIELLFSMTPKKARLIEAPQRQGYFVVYLDAIEQHDPRSQQDLIQGVRGSIARGVGNEFAQQMLTAIQRDLGVKRNQDVIDRVRKDLLSQGN